MKTYIITPTTGEKPYEIEADSYDFDETSGRHSFRANDELVANLLNVSVRLKPTEDA